MLSLAASQFLFVTSSAVVSPNLFLNVKYSNRGKNTYTSENRTPSGAKTDEAFFEGNRVKQDVATEGATSRK